MFTSIRQSSPTRRAALLAAAIVLVAAGSASARSGTNGSGHGSHTAGSPSVARVMSPPIIATKPSDKHHHHHHARFRFFDNWYWARACVIRYPARTVEEMRRIDPRWYARCHPIAAPAYY